MKIELEISEPYGEMLEEMREEMPNADDQLSSRFENLIHKNYQNFKQRQGSIKRKENSEQ